MGNIRKNYGIYRAKTMGYIGLRLEVIIWNIFGKIYGIFFEK